MEKNTYFIDPQKKEELARLQIQDSLFNEIFEPLPKLFVPKTDSFVLDLACGPGGWANMIAQTYGISTVGVDISQQMIRYARAQAEARQVPARFMVANILKFPWDVPDQHFDLVNSRFIAGLVPVVMYENLLAECNRVLRPGGVFCNTEAFYMSSPQAPFNQRLTMIIYEAMARAGLTYSKYDMASNAILAEMLKKMDFREQVLTPYVIDLAADTDIYQPMRENFKMSSYLLRSFIEQTGVCSLQEYDDVYEGHCREMSSPDFRAHWFLYSLSARKSS
jgi:ubiquinone/menaquinone biosynthesis C-methylase UbiE